MRYTIEDLKKEYQENAEALELLEEQKSDKQDEINEIEDLIKLIQLKGNLDNQIELCDEEINKINSFSVDFNTGAINLKNQISEKNEKVDYKNKLLECKKYIIDNKKNNENEIETLERLKEEKQNEIDKLEGEKQSKIKMLEHLNKVCTEQITKIQKKAETIEPIKNEINELERKINKIREYKFYTDEDIELITKYEKERGDKEKELSKINTEDNNSRLENIGKENMKVELSDLLERINMTLKYEKNKSDNNKENDNTVIGENENISEKKENEQEAIDKSKNYTSPNNITNKEKQNDINNIKRIQNEKSVIENKVDKGNDENLIDQDNEEKFLYDEQITNEKKPYICITIDSNIEKYVCLPEEPLFTDMIKKNDGYILKPEKANGNEMFSNDLECIIFARRKYKTEPEISPYARKKIDELYKKSNLDRENNEYRIGTEHGR